MTVLIKGMEMPEANGCYLLTIRYDADGNRVVFPLERLNGFDTRDIKRDVPHYPISELPLHAGRLKKEHNSHSVETATWTGNDEEAVKALRAVIAIDNYLEKECVLVNNTEWVDQRGYSFETDMGYFFQGLEKLEGCLIKRLRCAIPKYPQACQEYKEDE